MSAQPTLRSFAAPVDSSPNSSPAASDAIGVAMVALAAASWGTWSLFLRSSGLPATITAPALFLVMGLVPLPFALRGRRAPLDEQREAMGGGDPTGLAAGAGGQAPRGIDRSTITLIIVNGAFDALNVLAYFAAIRHTTVAIAVLTHYLAPILVALAAPRVEGVVSRGAGAAAMVALAGLVIVLEPWHAPAQGAVFGALLGVMSAVLYAGNVFASRRLAARVGATRQLSYHSLVGAAILFPLTLTDLGSITPAGAGYMLAGALTVGTISGVVFTMGLMRIGSARASVLTFAEPVVAVLVGAVCWGEPLRVTGVLGVLLVVGAGIQVVRKAR